MFSIELPLVPILGVTAALVALKSGVVPVRGCGIAPDGAFIVSASGDKLLSVWEVATGETAACMPLPGEGLCAAWDPREPLIACGDRGGSLYLLDLVGQVSFRGGRLDRVPGLQFPFCHKIPGKSVGAERLRSDIEKHGIRQGATSNLPVVKCCRWAQG